MSAVLTCAFARRASFDPRKSPNGSALPWFLGIATKEIARHRECERRWLDQEFPWAATSPIDVGEPADAINGISVRPRLATALKSLKKRDRDAFLLFVLADLTYEDVAAALGVPIGTVRSRIGRARERMAAMMRAEQ